MNSKPRVILVTGDGLRHRYVANRLAANMNLIGIVAEAKSGIVSRTAESAPADKALIEKHFEDRSAAERRLLGTLSSLPDTDVLTIANNTTNSAGTVGWIEAHSPDVLVLYGSGIIREPLLSHHANHVVNMHLGLSPYYRGSGTNFWPLVNREPECVGVTIHLAVPSVDAGPILAQGRPPVQLSDGIHDLGTKAIILGSELLVRTIPLYASSRLQPEAQDLSVGRVYRNKDFNAEALKLALRNISDGMLLEYIRNRHQRLNRFPIKELL